jgi:Flp pilus assembly protein TadD
MKALLFLVVALSLVGCATKKDKQEIQEKVSHSKVSDAPTLGKSIQDLINNSETLTDAQKKELEKIIEVNKKTAESLTEQSYKYRSVLIQELLSGKVNKKKVKLLKKDIKRVENLKLKNTFDTVEKISKIVSSSPDKEKFAQRLIIIDRPYR